jgi:hypothetical protein
VDLILAKGLNMDLVVAAVVAPDGITVETLQAHRASLVLEDPVVVAVTVKVMVLLVVMATYSSHGLN